MSMITLESEKALARLEEIQANRRTFLKGAAVAGVSLAGAGLLASKANAQSPDVTALLVKIFTVARTAEQLAVTFYTNGVANAATLGISDRQTNQLKAALLEEQIHLEFFTAQGGQSLADTFSFPQGASTFTNLATFITTQQQLEGAFDSAFLAALKAFASPPISNPGLAQIAAQIAMVESEHRALGRNIGGLLPADNWAFAPTILDTVDQAPTVLQAAGYLSPTAGNSYLYKPAVFSDPALAPIYAQIINKTPTAAEMG